VPVTFSLTSYFRTTMATPAQVVVAVGTYDGVLAGWEWTPKKPKFAISFATPVHEGSVRSVSIAQSNAAGPPQPGSLLSCGYDEVLRTHDFSKRLTCSGEIQTPADLGTPVCAAFAPPLSREADAPHATHCLLGFSAGQLVIYKKRDWSVQHILKGHDGGVSSMAVHPTGSMALTGGLVDGKLKLWDLTKGRLAHNHKMQPSRTTKEGKTSYDTINAIVWADQAYAFCYGTHLTVKDVASGKDLLDVELPSKVNAICFLEGPEGLFVVAANNDGSLAVLHVSGGDDDSDSEERKAIMAIGPVEGPVAGEERFRCLQQVADYHVVTANSAGVVSLMDLSGAVRIMMSEEDGESGEDDEQDSESDVDVSDDGEKELAVDIIASVQLGTGARITCLAAWSTLAPPGAVDDQEDDEDENVDEEGYVSPQTEKEMGSNKKGSKQDDSKRKYSREGNSNVEHMDATAMEKARELVASAKKLQAKRKKKKTKK
jgi:hypothetical protein